GNTEHSAGVLYRYVVVDTRELLRNLRNDAGSARELITGFLDAAILSLPQAKKNSTAPHTIPALVHLAVRTDRPVSYASAFEKPVRAGRDGGHTEPSITELDAYATAVNKLLGSTGIRYTGYASLAAKDVTGLGDRADSFHDLIQAATDAALPAGENQ
ncbi:type I-E CRISPR-associated protein Cas7/Cse4/CasC, partial [Streptomyces sp. GC420]|uniref:type I-E CRISPR-associated protein Cas7/Cse4/CasC n=1 Tax=Streptomyces sp. GC420 TaxID=2697568 RepID=UPI001AA0B2D0